MGTFTGKPVSVASKNAVGAQWNATPSGLTDDAALVAGVVDDDSSGIVLDAIPNSGDISFNIAIFLDTDPTTPITNVGNLPAGFAVLDYTLRIRLGSSILASPDHFAIGFSPSELVIITGEAPTTPNFTHIITHLGSAPSNLHLLGETPVVEVEDTLVGGSVNTSVRYIRIEGNYEIQSYSYEITPANGSEVEVGQVVNIVSPGNLASTPINFLNVTAVEVNGVEVTPITQTITGLSFAIPPGSGVITVELISSIFPGGTLTVASYTVLVANSSGIYVITPGNTHDVLYSSNRDGTTWNAKIPDPFIKTGFISG